MDDQLLSQPSSIPQQPQQTGTDRIQVTGVAVVEGMPAKKCGDAITWIGASVFVLMLGFAVALVLVASLHGDGLIDLFKSWPRRP